VREKEGEGGDATNSRLCRRNNGVYWGGKMVKAEPHFPCLICHAGLRWTRARVGSEAEGGGGV